MRCFAAVILSCLLASAARAAVLSAASIAAADIQAQVNLASDGDVILVPAGTASFTSSNVQVSNKAICIIGVGGTNSCVIADDLTGSGVQNQAAFFFTATDPTKHMRLSGFRFVNGTRTGNRTGGIVRIAGQSKCVRIDNCFFDQDKNTAITVNGGACGVWDEFTTKIESHTHAIFVKHESFDNVGVQGNKAWSVELSQLVPGGTSNTNKWWIQDGRTAQVETVPAYNAGSFIDSETGGRWGMSGMAFDGFEDNIVTHGDETPDPGSRGTQEIEIVGCTMAGADPNADGCINLRSGAGVICSNNFNTAGLAVNKSFIKLSNYRSTEPYFWGGINGKKVTPNFTNLWDQFDESTGTTPFYTNTHNGASGVTYFEDTNASWTVNQWYGYSIHNIDNPISTNSANFPGNTISTDWQTGYRYSMINSNTATRMFYLQASYFDTALVGPLMMRWTNGQRLELWKPTNSLGAVGLSKCDLRANGDPPVWLNFTNYGVNLWANTWNGVAVDGTNYGLKKDPIYREGYHFFNAVKPGWSFLGRHPLRVNTITLTPTTGYTNFGGQIDFNSSGGGVSTVALFTLYQNQSGATINSSTGLYTAGNANGTDIVRLYDTFYGNWSDVTVTVDDDGGSLPVAPNLRRTKRRAL